LKKKQRSKERERLETGIEKVENENFRKVCCICREIFGSDLIVLRKYTWEGQ
jgi:hypothetical protein